MGKIVIDQEKCIGCGTCSALFPKNFKLDKKGKAQVVKQSSISEKDIKAVISSCPVSAISYKKD